MAICLITRYIYQLYLVTKLKSFSISDLSQKIEKAGKYVSMRLISYTEILCRLRKFAVTPYPLSTECEIKHKGY